MRCCIDSCEKEAKYTIEWCGFNQYGEKPQIMDEADVCENPFHIIRASYHHEFGGTPDYVVSLEDGEDQPGLLEDIIETFRVLGL